MKFWTTSTDPAHPDRLVVDMTQCEECQRWLPPENMPLHLVYHKQQQHHDDRTDSHHTTKNQEEDSSLPAFVMETIPCHDCRVLVPKHNWAIHQIHGCSRGRQQEQGKYTDTTKDSSQDASTAAMILLSSSSICMETVECELCKNQVPIHNLELHLARACSALYHHPQQQQPPNEAASTEDNVENRTTDNFKDDDQNVGGESREISDNPYHYDSTHEWQKKEEHAFEDKKGEEDWECPRCTFQNIESKQNNSHDEEWKCRMCGYSLASALDDQEDQTPTSTTTAARSDNPPRRQQPSRWKALVTSWVPQEYHQLLPELFVDPDVTRKKKKKKKKHPSKQRASQHRASGPPTLLPPPTREELRQYRSPHLDYLEQERQQYWRLLHTTRQQKLQHQQRQQQQVIETAENVGEILLATTMQPAMSNQPDNVGRGNNDAPVLQGQQQSQSPPTHLELLEATEQLCLYHLEHLRRNRLIHDLKLDISLLGLPRWRHHLFHLLDLYQSAAEVYVDNIIWEIRMHFMQYATLEVMALLELVIWKHQIQQLTSATGMDHVEDHVDLSVATTTRREMRRACRNDRDIGIICQSVLPFLGRPQTRALRVM